MSFFRTNPYLGGGVGRSLLGAGPCIQNFGASDGGPIDSLPLRIARREPHKREIVRMEGLSLFPDRNHRHGPKRANPHTPLRSIAYNPRVPLYNMTPSQK